jgi:excisionase family DNA binding protein
MDERETVTTSEVMGLLGVSRATVTRLVKKGELEAYKLTPAKNSPLRIYKDSVEELLEERKQ